MAGGSAACGGPKGVVPPDAVAGVEAGRTCSLAWGPVGVSCRCTARWLDSPPRDRGWAARRLVLPRPTTGQRLRDLGLGWTGTVQESVRARRAAVWPAWLDRSARGRSAWAGWTGSSGQHEQLGVRGAGSFGGQGRHLPLRGAGRPCRPLRQLQCLARCRDRSRADSGLEQVSGCHGHAQRGREGLAGQIGQ